MRLNEILIVGRLTRDPEPPKKAGDSCVTSFSIAVDNPGKKETAGASFFDVKAWGEQQTTFLSRYFTKGSLILVKGSLKQETWTDTKTNEKKSRIVIVARDLGFAGSKEQQAPSTSPEEQRATRRTTDQTQSVIASMADKAAQEDDLPF